MHRLLRSVLLPAVGRQHTRVRPGRHPPGIWVASRAPPTSSSRSSPRPNRSYDRNLKRKHYLENGIPELWILDADEHAVEVWKPGDKEPAVVRDVLEWSVSGHRFGISLDEVFRG